VGERGLILDPTVLDKRHVHSRVGRQIRALALGRGRYGVVGGCDEERGRSGEEQGEMRNRIGDLRESGNAERIWAGRVVVFRLEATPREGKLLHRRRTDGRVTYIADGVRLLHERCPDEGLSSGGGGCV
jgi:hypothetical protein